MSAIEIVQLLFAIGVEKVTAAPHTEVSVLTVILLPHPIVTHCACIHPADKIPAKSGKILFMVVVLSLGWKVTKCFNRQVYSNRGYYNLFHASAAAPQIAASSGNPEGNILTLLR